MSRFTDQQCLIVDGADMTVKTRPGLDLQAIAALPGLMVEAKSLLQKAIIALDVRPLKVWTVAMAGHYFLIDTKVGPKAKELELIKRVLTSTLTGLSSDIMLKIGKTVGRDEDPGTMGAVSRSVGSAGTKSYHTVVPTMKPAGFLKKPETYVRGAMKLQDSVLLGELGVVTLIHEATHKFAGTYDYCYFDDATGYVPRSKFTNKEKALANADSHAYFAVRVGRQG